MENRKSNSPSALPFWLLILLGIILWFVLAYLPLSSA